LFCIFGEFFVGDINGFSRGIGYQKTSTKSKKTGTKSKNGHQKNKKRRGKTIKKRRQQAIFAFFVRSDRFFGVFCGAFRLFYKHLPCVPWSLLTLLIVLQAPSRRSPDTFLVIFEHF
jgi:hypothetical protein